MHIYIYIYIFKDRCEKSLYVCIWPGAIEATNAAPAWGQIIGKQSVTTVQNQIMSRIATGWDAHVQLNMKTGVCMPTVQQPAGRPQGNEPNVLTRIQLYACTHSCKDPSRGHPRTPQPANKLPAAESCAQKLVKVPFKATGSVAQHPHVGEFMITVYVTWQFMDIHHVMQHYHLCTIGDLQM